MTLHEPPHDPAGVEGWEECPRCKGAGVEMAARAFEVYARFSDDVDAREFMERLSRDDDMPSYGIRAVEPDSLSEQLRRDVIGE